MAKNNQINKLDIARWIAVFPVTIIAIFTFSSIFMGFLYKILPKFFNEEIVSNIAGITSAIGLPFLIIACGYWISPRFKFRSTTILVFLFLLLQAWHLFDSEYARSNPFNLLFAVSYLLGLFIIYKLGRK